MIEVKTVTNTNNKEEFINKKTLRRTLSEHLLAILDDLKGAISDDDTDRTVSYYGFFVYSCITAHRLGIIDKSETIEFERLSDFATELIKPLALVVLDELVATVQNSLN